MPADQIAQELTAGGFTVVQKSVPGSSARAGVVFNQSPAADTQVSTGTVITIDISTGTPGTPSTAGTVACSASQFVVGTPIQSGGASALGTDAEYDLQPLHNSGAPCTFNLPSTVEVASATGPFHLVTTTNSGYETPHTIAHGTSITIALGAWWPIPGMQPIPGETPPACDDPITNVSRVAIPMGTSNLQLAPLGHPWQWQKVCTTPANVGITVNG